MTSILRGGELVDPGLGSEYLHMVALGVDGLDFLIHPFGSRRDVS
jgi:hypothetical protein